jgi:hypothetical protein
MADRIAGLPACGWCGFVVVTGKRCSCRTIAYCDKVCQRRHWQEHKFWCSWRSRNRQIRNLVDQHGLEPAVVQTLLDFGG